MRLIQNFAIVAIMLTLHTSNLLAQDVDRMFYVNISKAVELSGQLVEISEFKVETSFGSVTIPIDKIEAVRMRADGNDSAAIALTNGDMLTGKIEFEELHLKTNWGKAHINVSSVESFSASPQGRFYTDPTVGGWRYSRGTATSGTPQRTINNTQGSGARFGSGFGN